MSKDCDIQQVCENGHQITDCYNIKPETRKKFCPDCGASTLTTCPSCNGQIQGAQIDVRRDLLAARTGRQEWHCKVPADVPSFCTNCGKPELAPLIVEG